jgi:hypothetical protein
MKPYDFEVLLPPYLSKKIINLVKDKSLLSLIKYKEENINIYNMIQKKNYRANKDPNATRFEPSNPRTNGLMATFDFPIKKKKKDKLPGIPLFLPWLLLTSKKL